LPRNKLSSPHIAKFKGCATTQKGGIRGNVREFPERGYLQSLLYNRNCSWAQKLKWAAQICHELVSIHAVGITHCDLRRSDVHLNKKCDVKIMDIATGHGWLNGFYPTKRRENELLDHPKWDVFSFGITLWEIVNDGSEGYVKRGNFEFGEFEELENLSEEGRKLVNTMKKCLEEDPEKRPTLEDAFEEYLQDGYVFQLLDTARWLNHENHFEKSPGKRSTIYIIDLLS
jgi:serine/threonine protein kinase